MINLIAQPKYFQAVHNPIEFTFQDTEFQENLLFYVEVMAIHATYINLTPSQNLKVGTRLATLIQNGNGAGQCTFEISDILATAFRANPFVPALDRVFQEDQFGFKGYYLRHGTISYSPEGVETKTKLGETDVKWVFRGAFPLDGGHNFDDWWASFSNEARFLTFSPTMTEVNMDENALLGVIVPFVDADTAASSRELRLVADFYYRDGTSELGQVVATLPIQVGMLYYVNARPNLIQPAPLKVRKLHRYNVWLDYRTQVATAWRGTGFSCILVNGDNSGYEGYSQQEEYAVANGLPTGNYRPNDPASPDFIPGTLNEENCPRPVDFAISNVGIGTYTVSNFTGGQPSATPRVGLNGGSLALWPSLYSPGYELILIDRPGGDNTITIKKGTRQTTKTVRVPWGNQAQVSTYTRNNCGSGFNGGDVTYTVPANKYTSLVSQQDADNQAYAELVANGQNHANTYGTCTAIPPAIKRTITIGISQTNYSPDFTSSVTVTYQSNGVAAVGYVGEGGNSFQVDDGTPFTLEPYTSGNYSGNGFIGYRNIYNQIITPPFYAVSDYAITCLFDMRVANTPGGGDGTSV